MAKNKKCILCQKEYEYCDTCRSKSYFEPAWRNAWDTENCKDIFGVLATYINGKISAVDAKKQLKDFDLKDKDGFIPKMKKAVDEIMAVIIPDEEAKEEVKEEAKKDVVKNEEDVKIGKFDKKKTNKKR